MMHTKLAVVDIHVPGCLLLARAIAKAVAKRQSTQLACAFIPFTVILLL